MNYLPYQKEEVFDLLLLEASYPSKSQIYKKIEKLKFHGARSLRYANILYLVMKRGQKMFI